MVFDGLFWKSDHQHRKGKKDIWEQYDSKVQEKRSRELAELDASQASYSVQPVKPTALPHHTPVIQIGRPQTPSLAAPPKSPWALPDKPQPAQLDETHTKALHEKPEDRIWNYPHRPD